MSNLYIFVCKKEPKMKFVHTALFIFLFCILTPVYSQKAVTAKLLTKETSSLNGVIPPLYKDGEKALYEFLETNIKYPPILIKIKMEGDLELKFNVAKDGSVKDVEIVRGFDPDADDEVIRVLQAMPKWSPALLDGNPVDFTQHLSVTFKLTDALIAQAKEQPKNEEQKLTNESSLVMIPTDTLTQIEEKQIVQESDSLNTDPQYPGGQGALDTYLKTNMKYPKRAIKYGIEGRVIFNIEVSAEGEISKIWLFKGVFPDCNEEAYYLIKKMPKWIPGLKDGVPVAKQVMLPISFELPK